MSHFFLEYNDFSCHSYIMTKLNYVNFKSYKFWIYDFFVKGYKKAGGFLLAKSVKSLSEKVDMYKVVKDLDNKRNTVAIELWSSISLRL